jgi:hypothetical protein
MAKMRDILLWEKRKSIILSEGSQASLAYPSDKGCVKVKTLECLETVASEGAAGL